MTNSLLKLLPDENERSQPLFTEHEYQEFTLSFHDQVKAELDRYREARRRSEEQAKRHLVY